MRPWHLGPIMALGVVVAAAAVPPSPPASADLDVTSRLLGDQRNTIEILRGNGVAPAMAGSTPENEAGEGAVSTLPRQDPEARAVTS